MGVQAPLLYLTTTASKTLQIRNQKKLNYCEQKWAKKSPTLISAEQNQKHKVPPITKVRCGHGHVARKKKGGFGQTLRRSVTE